jgi:hypothetical protein
VDIRRHQYFVAILHNDKHLVCIGVSASLVNADKRDFARQIGSHQELQYFLTMLTIVAVIKNILIWHWNNKIY